MAACERRGARGRRAAACAIVAVVSTLVCLIGWQAMASPPTPFDDARWIRRSAEWPIPSGPQGMEREHWLQSDVPSLNRWLFGAVMRLWTPTQRQCTWPVVGQTNQWNVEHGLVPPIITQEALRLANVALFAGMVAILWAVAAKAIGLVAWGGVVVLPITLSSTYATLMAYAIGPNTLLSFTCALVLGFWFAFHLKGQATGLKAVAGIGALCGLAVSAKLNGGLVLLAFCGYLAFESGGWRKLVNPLIAVAAALFVFGIVNPVFFVDPFGGPLGFIRQALHRRAVVVDTMDDRWGAMTWTQVVQRALPSWPLLPALAVAIWRRRGEKWFAPVAWWGGFLFVGTIFTINQPVPRYVAPLELGFYFLATLCVVAEVRSLGGAKAAASPSW